MAYGQADDLADAYSELAKARKQIAAAKEIILKIATGETPVAESRAWLEEHFPELTVEEQAPKKIWD